MKNELTFRDDVTYVYFRDEYGFERRYFFMENELAMMTIYKWDKNNVKEYSDSLGYTIDIATHSMLESDKDALIILENYEKDIENLKKNNNMYSDNFNEMEGRSGKITFQYINHKNSPIDSYIKSKASIKNNDSYAKSSVSYSSESTSNYEFDELKRKVLIIITIIILSVVIYGIPALLMDSGSSSSSSSSSSKLNARECPSCHGAGYVKQYYTNDPNEPSHMERCNTCGGAGWVTGR